MNPSKGCIVLAVGAAATSNGSDEAPAIITRVWNEVDGRWCVNATVFPDYAQPKLITSAYLHNDEEKAREALRHESMTALYWPPRV